jgi:hypothetical protein
MRYIVRKEKFHLITSTLFSDPPSVPTLYTVTGVRICNRLPCRIRNTSLMLLDVISEDFTICEKDIEGKNPSQGRSHRE